MPQMLDNFRKNKKRKEKVHRFYSSHYLMIILSYFLGEIYIAFFNLNPAKTVISAKISDLAKVLPGKNLNGTSCKCREVWSGKEIAVYRVVFMRRAKCNEVFISMPKCDASSQSPHLLFECIYI